MEEQFPQNDNQVTMDEVISGKIKSIDYENLDSSSMDFSSFANEVKCNIPGKYKAEEVLTFLGSVLSGEIKVNLINDSQKERYECDLYSLIDEAVEYANVSAANDFFYNLVNQEKPDLEAIKRACDTFVSRSDLKGHEDDLYSLEHAIDLFVRKGDFKYALELSKSIIDSAGKDGACLVNNLISGWLTPSIKDIENKDNVLPFLSGVVKIGLENGKEYAMGTACYAVKALIENGDYDKVAESVENCFSEIDRKGRNYYDYAKRLLNMIDGDEKISKDEKVKLVKKIFDRNYSHSFKDYLISALAGLLVFAPIVLNFRKSCEEKNLLTKLNLNGNNKSNGEVTKVKENEIPDLN